MLKEFDTVARPAHLSAHLGGIVGPVGSYLRQFMPEHFVGLAAWGHGLGVLTTYPQHAQMPCWMGRQQGICADFGSQVLAKITASKTETS